MIASAVDKKVLLPIRDVQNQQAIISAENNSLSCKQRRIAKLAFKKPSSSLTTASEKADTSAVCNNNTEEKENKSTLTSSTSEGSATSSAT